MSLAKKHHSILTYVFKMSVLLIILLFILLSKRSEFIYTFFSLLICVFTISNVYLTKGKNLNELFENIF